MVSLTCHFVDDHVMPGTLMYECCLHTLRIYLLRLGWVGDGGRCRLRSGARRRQPVEMSRTGDGGDAKSRVRSDSEGAGYRPEPYALADALMYADGKLIVEITNMSVRSRG